MVNIKKLFMDDLLSNGLHEKVMMFTSSRLDVQLVRNNPLKMVIGQQVKQRGLIKIINGFHI